jgi:chromosome segregation ATPase
VLKYAGYYWLGIVTAIVCACVSAGAVDSPVLEHQQQIARLEATIGDLQGRIDKYDSVTQRSTEQLTAIRERTADNIGTVDELIQLFGEYQREVERMLQDYRQLQDASQ